MPLTASAANLNNFTITDYDIQYLLGRDDAGHSTLQTTETITANFPPNQNRGIERAVPRSYDGHTINLDIVSVKDQSGEDRQYSTYVSNDNTVIRIGNPDVFVSGTQTYVITYTQTNVTKNFDDSQEFYWDTNGTDWKVPIQNLEVNLQIDVTVADSFNGDASCYQGTQGSSETCEIARQAHTYSVVANELAPGENVTIALGFAAETWSEYQTPLWQVLLIGWIFLQVALGFVSFGLILWLSIRYYHRSQRSAEHNPIAPEYLPPRDSSIEISSSLLSASHKSFSAQIIDLAVRHYIKIHEVKAKSFLSAAQYELEITRDTTDLRVEEVEFINDLFGPGASVGSRLNMKTLRNNSVVYARFQDNPTKTKKLIRDKYELRSKDPEQSGWYRRTSLIILLVGILLLSPPLLVVAIVSFVMSHTLHPLTDKGLALLRYLKGLKMYIKVGEAERLRMLQSPEGAEKVGQADSPAKLVKLYEKVLPYAVLFGIEKDWNKQLGNYYESSNTQPDWYSGYGGAAFSAASFSSAMSSFSTTSSYSSQSSSSSSGSSGGGFSGGGGGGGGGGGW